MHEDFKPGPQPKLYDSTAKKLVATLSHPNGWWRDSAQKLLALRQDRSVVPALVQLAENASAAPTRIHALWTLEGLDAAEAPLVRKKLKDSDPQVRAAALRVSERLFKAGDTSFLEDILALAKDPDGSVASQVLCSSRLVDPAAYRPLVQSSLNGATGHPSLREIAMQMLAPKRNWGREFSAPEKALLTNGNEIFNEFCLTCHSPDGQGTPVEGSPGVTLAPPWLAPKRWSSPKTP